MSPRGIERQRIGLAGPGRRDPRQGRGKGAALDARGLDALVSVGVSIHDAPLALRLHVARRLQESAVRAVDAADFAAVLATCARGEIYGFAPGLADADWRARFA